MILMLLISSLVSAKELSFRQISLKGKTCGEVCKILKDSLGFEKNGTFYNSYSGSYIRENVIVTVHGFDPGCYNENFQATNLSVIFVESVEEDIYDKFELVVAHLIENFGLPEVMGNYKCVWRDDNSETVMLLKVDDIRFSRLKLLFMDISQNKPAYLEYMKWKKDDM